MKNRFRGRIFVVFLIFAVTGLIMGGMSYAGDSGSIVDTLDLNTATVKELSKLPGVGKKKAEAIVTYRSENGRFSDINQLKEVNGIGKKTFEKLKDYVTVKGS